MGMAGAAKPHLGVSRGELSHQHPGWNPGFASLVDTVRAGRASPNAHPGSPSADHHAMRLPHDWFTELHIPTVFGVAPTHLAMKGMLLPEDS